MWTLQHLDGWERAPADEASSANTHSRGELVVLEAVDERVAQLESQRRSITARATWKLSSNHGHDVGVDALQALARCLR